MIKGIDISKYNPVVDLKKTYANGYHFVIIKATNGFVKDPQLDKAARMAIDAGMTVGFYHYPSFQQDGEAEFFLETVKPYVDLANGEVLYHHLDIESAMIHVVPPVYGKRAFKWLNYVEANHKKPGVYSNRPEWQRWTVNAKSNFWGWVAQWTTAQQPTAIPIGWDVTRVKFWQYGIAGQHPWCPITVPGITGKVDVDYFLGNEKELSVLSSKAYDDEILSSKPISASLLILMDGTEYTADEIVLEVNK